MPNYMWQNRKLGSIVKNYGNICQHLLKTDFFYVTRGTCIAKVQRIKLKMCLRKDNKIPKLHHFEWIEFSLFILIKH